MMLARRALVGGRRGSAAAHSWCSAGARLSDAAHRPGHAPAGRQRSGHHRTSHRSIFVGAARDARGHRKFDPAEVAMSRRRQSLAPCRMDIRFLALPRSIVSTWHLTSESCRSRYYARRDSHPCPVRHVGEPFGAIHNDFRVHQLRQGPSRQDQHGFAWHRQSHWPANYSR